MVLFNAVLMRIEGYRAVAAFSIVMYVDSVVKSVLFGMGDALQPALSYNYGAKQPGRVLALERRVQLAGFVISFAMMVWMLAGGRGLITLFSPPGDAALLTMSLRAMRLFALSYLVSWCAIVSSSFFTALDRPLFSLVQSTCATLLFPLIGLAVLPAVLGLDGVWLTGLFGGALSALLAAVLLWRTMRRLKRRAA